MTERENFTDCAEAGTIVYMDHDAETRMAVPTVRSVRETLLGMNGSMRCDYSFLTDIKADVSLLSPEKWYSSYWHNYDYSLPFFSDEEMSDVLINLNATVKITGTHWRDGSFSAAFGINIYDSGEQCLMAFECFADEWEDLKPFIVKFESRLHMLEACWDIECRPIGKELKDVPPERLVLRIESPFYTNVGIVRHWDENTVAALALEKATRDKQ